MGILARAFWLIPLFWLMPALVAVVGAAVALVVLGHGVEALEPTFEGMRVALAATDGSVVRGVPASLRLSLMALGAWLAIGMRHRAPVVAPLVVIALGRAAVAGLVFEIFFEKRLWAMAAAVAALGVMGVGLRWSIDGETYLRRAGQAALLLMPATLLYLAPVGRFGRLPWFVFAMLLADSAAAILMAAAGRAVGRGTIASPLRWVAAAVAMTLILAGGIQAGGERARAAERARLQRELSQVPEVAEPATYPRRFFQRGISFVRDGYGAYYPKRSGLLLDALRSHGVDAVALIPYGRGRKDGAAVQFDINADTRAIYKALARLAHGRGMRILVKPQLMIFGARFPGELEIADAAARRAWFASYGKFIVEWARLSAQIHADLFSVGTELVKLSRYEEEWRELIARVREVYPGPLVYAATQGEEFETLRFWDALDYIGLNNYYPLPDSLDASAVVAKVEAVQRRFGKPVVFTETGFASVEGSHREPWAEPAAPVSLDHQARCYEALFRAFYDKPWFDGMYWWKLSADGRGGPEDRSLTPWRKPAMETVRRWYTRPRSEANSAGE